MVKLKKTDDAVHAKNTPATIGERLRMARENKGLSFEDAHKATKIHPKTIEALEKDSLGEKLGNAYVRAFIKNYASYLGMDGRSLAAEYASEGRRGGEDSSSAVNESGSAHKKKTAALKKYRFAAARFAAAALAFIILLFALALGTAKMGRYVKSVFFQLKTKSAANKLNSASLPGGAALPKPAAMEIVPIPRQGKLTLAISASADAWLKVTLDGKVAFHGILPKKSKEIWKAEKEIRISEIGKPESLRLNVNGKDIDFSKNLRVKSILITQEGVDFEPR